MLPCSLVGRPFIVSIVGFGTVPTVMGIYLLELENIAGEPVENIAKRPDSTNPLARVETT